jgi:predicted Zn-dependent peptidase
MDYEDKVNRMSIKEVLKEVLKNPTYLTDPFYREKGVALEKKISHIINCLDLVEEEA